MQEHQLRPRRCSSREVALAHLLCFARREIGFGLSEGGVRRRIRCRVGWSTARIATAARIPDHSPGPSWAPRRRGGRTGHPTSRSAQRDPVGGAVATPVRRLHEPRPPASPPPTGGRAPAPRWRGSSPDGSNRKRLLLTRCMYASTSSRAAMRHAGLENCGSRPPPGPASSKHQIAGGRRTGPCARDSGSVPPAPGTAGARRARAIDLQRLISHAADEHAGDRPGRTALALVRQHQRTTRVEPLQTRGTGLQPPVRAPPPQQLVRASSIRLKPAQYGSRSDQRPRTLKASGTSSGQRLLPSHGVGADLAENRRVGTLSPPKAHRRGTVRERL